jgi:CheY-like chemotaxis protein
MVKVVKVPRRVVGVLGSRNAAVLDEGTYTISSCKNVEGGDGKHAVGKEEGVKRGRGGRDIARVASLDVAMGAAGGGGREPAGVVPVPVHCPCGTSPASPHPPISVAPAASFSSTKKLSKSLSCGTQQHSTLTERGRSRQSTPAPPDFARDRRRSQPRRLRERGSGGSSPSSSGRVSSHEPGAVDIEVGGRLRSQFDGDESVASASLSSLRGEVREAGLDRALAGFTMGPLQCEKLAQRLGGVLEVSEEPPYQMLLYLPLLPVSRGVASLLGGQCWKHGGITGLGRNGCGFCAEGIHENLGAMGYASSAESGTSGESDWTKGVTEERDAAATAPGQRKEKLQAGDTRRRGVEKTASAKPPLRVLICDDERVNCKIVSVLLRRMGHRSTMLSDGDEIVAELQRAVATGEDPYDLLLLDIVMKRSNGVDVCKTLLKEERTTFPIVAMTANANTEDIRICECFVAVEVQQHPPSSLPPPPHPFFRCKRWVCRRSRETLCSC